MDKVNSTRRSQRRLNKMLDKNISEYSIPNPYRNYRVHPFLPKNLSKQLSRVDYFSIKTLQNLDYTQPYIREELTDLLLKMKKAVEKQALEFSSYISIMGK